MEALVTMGRTRALCFPILRLILCFFSVIDVGVYYQGTFVPYGNTLLF